MKCCFLLRGRARTAYRHHETKARACCSALGNSRVSFGSTKPWIPTAGRTTSPVVSAGPPTILTARSGLSISNQNSPPTAINEWQTGLVGPVKVALSLAATNRHLVRAVFKVQICSLKTSSKPEAI
jgi:hypothetical protein